MSNGMLPSKAKTGKNGASQELPQYFFWQRHFVAKFPGAFDHTFVPALA